MFQGTIPEKAMKVIANVVKDWKCKNIYVGCSGNFTIERCINRIFEGKIYSNDVTIYSSTIGRFFAGQDLKLSIREEYTGPCSYMRNYWNTDVEKVATLILAADIIKFDVKEISYFLRMRRAYEEQWPEMHARMCEKLSNIKLKVEKFYCGDVMKMLDEIPEEDGFLSFPPFFKGGYEKMWKDLDLMFDFEKPEYEEFDPKTVLDLFVDKVLRIQNFCIGAGEEIPKLKEYFMGSVETGKGKMVYLYSRTERKIYVKKSNKNTVLKLERISKEDDITDITVCKLTHEQFEELRAVYLNKGINVARESTAYGLFTREKLFGCFAFSSSPTLSNFDGMIAGPQMYMMTDFAVGPTKVKQLSKLVLYCILSKEVKMIAERDKGKRVRSIVTNAFCKNQQSMKYRGMFEILNKKKVTVAGGEERFNITYGAKAGQWTLQEGYELWKRKL